jgi:hypothetical protein
MEHSLAKIERIRALPMVKEFIPAAGRDAMMAASALAAEVLAHASVSGNAWGAYAWRVIDMTTDAREHFLKLLSKQHKDEKENFVRESGRDVKDKDAMKLAGKVVASNTTQLSNLRTIATACDMPAWSEDGLYRFVGELKGMSPDMVEQDDIKFNHLFLYARQVKGSAGSRTKDAWMTKLSKWLEKNRPAEDDEEGQAGFIAIVETYNAQVEAAQE